MTSEGSAVTTVGSGSAVTLTATVTASGTPVTVGQVDFCDATAAYCRDIHVLGTEQLTSAGRAVLNLIPGIGNHSYKAVFLGTTSNATSASSNAALTVTAAVLHPTTTTIAQSGNSGSYELTATVLGTGAVASPTGTVSFLDTSNGNAVLAATVLSGGKATIAIPAGTLGLGSTTLTAIYAPDASGSATYGVAMGTSAVTVTTATPD
jgi:hypothetical protein